MPRWIPAIDTNSRADAAIKMGIYGALGFAAWIGIPSAWAITGHQFRAGMIAPPEIAVVVILVGFAFLTAWRFYKHCGWIAGPILLVALVVEVVKRLFLTVNVIPGFGILDALIAIMVFFGLLNGVRGARAFRHRPPENDKAGEFTI